MIKKLIFYSLTLLSSYSIGYIKDLIRSKIEANNETDESCPTPRQIPQPNAVKNSPGTTLFGMSVFFAWLLIFGIGTMTFAQDHPSPGSDKAVEDSLALEKYIRQALENSPRLEALFQQYYARLEQIPQVGALPDPEVMFQYHINPMEQSNPLTRTTVSAKQMFPWFGTLGKRKEQVEKLSRVQWTAFEEARNNLVLEIKKQWYRMHEMHHHLMIFRRNLGLLERLEQQVRTRYESGRATQVDLLRIQIEQEDLKTRIVNSDEKLAAMKIRFNALLDRESYSEIDIPEAMYSKKLSMSEENIRKVIYDRNPRLRGREYEEEAALAAEEQARLEGRPSFGLGVMVMNKNYMYMPLMAGDGPALTGSLTISLPLYRSKYQAQQKEARIEARAAREEQREIANQLNAEAESLLQQYHDARRRILLHEEKLISKTRQALEIAMAEYSSGQADFEQIIQLQQQLLDYEMKLNTAYVDQNIATAEIENIAGEYNITPDEINNR